MGRSRSLYEDDLDILIRDLISHLLERPDDNPTKTGEQHSKCGGLKAL